MLLTGWLMLSPAMYAFSKWMFFSLLFLDGLIPVLPSDMQWCLALYTALFWVCCQQCRRSCPAFQEPAYLLGWLKLLFSTWMFRGLRGSLCALSHFDIRSTFMWCMFNVSFCFLGDCVGSETFIMGHRTNFAFSVIGHHFTAIVWDKSMGLGSAAWDWILNPTYFWTGFLTFLRLRFFSYEKLGENNLIGLLWGLN